jgi:hypothetical protein
LRAVGGGRCCGGFWTACFFGEVGDWVRVCELSCVCMRMCVVVVCIVCWYYCRLALVLLWWIDRGGGKLCAAKVSFMSRALAHKTRLGLDRFALLSTPTGSIKHPLPAMSHANHTPIHLPTYAPLSTSHPSAPCLGPLSLSQLPNTTATTAPTFHMRQLVPCGRRSLEPLRTSLSARHVPPTRMTHVGWRTRARL